MEVTNSNYFSTAVGLEYITNSQYHDFTGTPARKGCEARALNNILMRDENNSAKTTALLVGGYVDAYFEGSLEEYKEKNPSIFKKDGDLRAEYKRANDIIRFAQDDELFMNYMSGEKQVIFTGDLNGFKVLGKLDVLHDHSFVDQKAMADMNDVYCKGIGYVNFIDAYGYADQGALYQHLIEQNTGKILPFFLAVLTKEAQPDKAVIHIPDSKLKASLNVIEGYLSRIFAIKQGFIEPIRCESCDYCKATKKLTNTISYEDFL